MNHCIFDCCSPKRTNGLWILAVAWLIAGLILFLSGCSDDDKGTQPVPDNGYEAQVQDLQAYVQWSRADYTTFPTNSASLGEAHEGNTPERVREVWASQNLSISDSTYPRETIIVKETHGWTDSGDKIWPAMGGVLAMVKRGGEFNPSGGGWEYFILSNDASQIMERGTNVMNGMCMACHNAASFAGGKDYVFAHPSATNVIPDGEEWDFIANRETWDRVDSTFGPDPFLSGMHGQTEDFSREIYRWQPAARAVNGQFPVGTLLLKVASTIDSTGHRNYPMMGSVTGMVKRGAGFDSANGNWEWFMFSHGDSSVVRGNGTMMNMCVACHSAANSGAGADFVFRHPHLGN
ncbi:cytochrome P460 family protein [candidate division KSB1 bacterium]|nr:cytochrome P460 family protein [candidate division KSB1 bacterium]